MPAKRPTKVIIGPHTFKILYSEASYHKYCRIADGLASYTKTNYEIGRTFMRQSVIVIRSEKIPSIQTQKETLMHEILHAINMVIGWPHSFGLMERFDTDDEWKFEEILVSFTAPILLLFWRCNPEVTKWLLSD